MSKIIVSWTPYAKFSYFDELDFIESKWTSKEVNAFIALVNGFIENLSCGIIQGKKYSPKNIHSLVISKQTTVFYRMHPDQDLITLLLFWNNQKDSNMLKKTLQRI
ncbi:hypothetical protein H2O64_05895 [Kordia sp. YSTF-M3]|uniref:Type II toxin-antitoxin system RelE/ParE family toxin n=1 Tax=Kordia aestuariivivens TaxID=2759037 RepID=A0ABR7Q6K4_9FLAO|nr:hypothetical protein [Kordia aestuariivivens]MBC8754195.1 hypothetical protein [Kordia aestuariivivens]